MDCGNDYTHFTYSIHTSYLMVQQKVNSDRKQEKSDFGPTETNQHKNIKNNTNKSNIYNLKIIKQRLMM